MTTANLFTYGTLMIPEVIKAVLKRTPDVYQRASLADHICRVLTDESFPGIKPARDEVTPGLLYKNISEEDLTLLDEYEGELFQRNKVTVLTDDGNRAIAWSFVIKPQYAHLLSNQGWNWEQFIEEGLASYVPE
ncbi:gamma-glutamylcyclotransferase family protein [Marinobacterium jannaschii]|uniref:gamma-glutamylcyclotransferase family protein n=1 Tax=Marinobacterium jannaschii TaxID=64970 RepID=UPI0004817790|nr:gamma-glutamylcyclotransferase family protein [Marinobacterium jannaschii]